MTYLCTFSCPNFIITTPTSSLVAISTMGAPKNKHMIDDKKLKKIRRNHLPCYKGMVHELHKHNHYQASYIKMPQSLHISVHYKVGFLSETF